MLRALEPRHDAHCVTYHDISRHLCTTRLQKEKGLLRVMMDYNDKGIYYIEYAHFLDMILKGGGG